jgi:hypothetical protein
VIDLGAKKERGRGRSFAFRVKLGEYEFEVGGTRDEVLKTIEDLPSLIGNIQRAFDSVRAKKFATLTVKTETPKDQKATSEKYPRISAAETSGEAVLSLLETDWGKWRPRTIDELGDALKSNGIDQSPRTLTAALMELVKKEKIRRWNTNAGYVYILAEKEALRSRGDAE